MNETKALLAEFKEIVTRIKAESEKKFRTAEQVEEAINTAIAEKGLPSMEIVESVPAPADAELNTFYLVKNSESGHLDIYMLIGNKMEWIDDTTVDLSNYFTKEQTNSLLENKVNKDGNKVLTDVNFSTADKAKLDSIEIPTEAEVAAMLDEVFGS